MSVMACDRVGCESVMCDVLLNDKLVCKECADEFIEKMGRYALWEKHLIEHEFTTFMETTKLSKRDRELITAEQLLERRKFPS